MSNDGQRRGADESAPEKELVVSDPEGNLYILPADVLAASKIQNSGDKAYPGNNTFDFGSSQLRTLCDVNGFSDRKTQIVNLFQDFSVLCKSQDLRLPPRWSGVGDDCTPFELSVEI